MISNAADIITIITIILIGAILTIYLLVLKKNGWLGQPSNYRCPNPQCQKIFQSPLKVKDYSTKKETHLACPECGYDLGYSNNEKTLKQNIIEKAEVETQDSTVALIESDVSIANKSSKENESNKTAPHTDELNQDQTPQKTNVKCLKETSIESKSKLETKDSASIPNETALSLIRKENEEPKALKTALQSVKVNESESSQKANHKKVVDVRKETFAGCNHYFGYLWALPKDTQTPDECYTCPRLIECYIEIKE